MEPPGIGDKRALQAAAFLAQALDLADAPAALVPDLTPVDRDPMVVVFAAELDSSLGPAAFLVYAYDLGAADAEGRPGRARFDADLAVMQRAAELDAPGPRPVAHALTDEDGFILATSPATLRALSREAGAAATDPPTDPTATGDPEETRRRAAGELLRLLRQANEEAIAWSRAVAVRERPGDQATAGGFPPRSAFTPEETELALFLLDERSIQDLLIVVDRILNAARQR